MFASFPNGDETHGCVISMDTNPIESVYQLQYVLEQVSGVTLREKTGLYLPRYSHCSHRESNGLFKRGYFHLARIS